jgi:hypothetical protein
VKPNETFEGRLADMIEAADAGPYTKVAVYLDAEECAVIVKALRERARWMASDIKSGERKTPKGQNRQSRA